MTAHHTDIFTGSIDPSHKNDSIDQVPKNNSTDAVHKNDSADLVHKTSSQKGLIWLILSHFLSNPVSNHLVISKFMTVHPTKRRDI